MMNPIYPLFISYRKVDGGQLAFWLFSQLKNKSKLVVDGNETHMCYFDPVFDLSIPGGVTWQAYLNEQLEKVKSLIIACTPGTMIKKNYEDDWLYYELEWWTVHRKDAPPILVSTDIFKNRWVPEIITNCWPGLQVTEISTSVLNDTDKAEQRRIDTYLDSIISGLILSGTQHSSSTTFMYPEMSLAKINGIFAWEKDRYGKYTYVNESYARAAGFDSPRSLIGKTDFEMPWRSLAEMFRQGDREVMKGDIKRVIGTYEKEIMFDKVIDILVHEQPTYDSSGNVTGVTGSFVDVTAMTQLIQLQKFKIDDEGIHLGDEFAGEILTRSEILVFQAFVLNKTDAQIKVELGLNNNQYTALVNSLKKKFCCKTKQEMLVTAVRAGLPIRLFAK